MSLLDGDQFDSARTGELLNCLQVTVEMNHADGSISSINTPQKRKSNCVVTTEGNDSRQRPTIFRGTFSLRIGGGGAIQNAVVTLLDLLNCVGIVIAEKLLSVVW